MNRRGFLGSILAACAAPAIVRADSLMRIVPLDTVILPAFHPDAILMEADAIDGGLVALDRMLREWSQYDLAREATITRYDVQAESVNGVWQQLTVDFIGGDPGENRDIARSFLAGRLRADGVTPKPWKGDMPNGARLI